MAKLGVVTGKRSGSIRRVFNRMDGRLATADQWRAECGPALLRAMRDLLGITQQAGARRLGVGRSELSEYERGARVPPWELLREALRVYGGVEFQEVRAKEGGHDGD